MESALRSDSSISPGDVLRFLNFLGIDFADEFTVGGRLRGAPTESCNSDEAASWLAWVD